MYNTKLKYRINEGEIIEATLENPFGHPMEGNIPLDSFDIWMTATDSATTWTATAHDLESDDVLEDVTVEILEVSFPQK